MSSQSGPPHGAEGVPPQYGDNGQASGPPGGYYYDVLGHKYDTPGAGRFRGGGPASGRPVLPDPVAAGKTQNINNHPEQNTPFGHVGYATGPDGRPIQTTTLDPTLQGTLDNLKQDAFSASGRPLPDGSAARDQAIQGAYSQATSRLNPQWAQRDEQLGSQLANQGLDPNSQAYRTAMQQEGQQKNDAYSSAMNGAIAQGTAAGSTIFNQGVTSRMLPYQQMGDLKNLTSPQPYNTDNATLPAAVAGGTQQIQLTQLQQSQLADLVHGGMDVVTALATLGIASDARVKHNVNRLPVDAIPGVPLATFEYNHAPGQQHLGVIAQDLEAIAPEHVATGPGGVKLVSESFRPFAIGGPAGFKPFGGK